MARQPTALPVLPLPQGDDPLLSPDEVAKALRMSAARFCTYWKRFPYLVAGIRIVQSVEGGRGCMHFLRSYVTAHTHREMPRTRDAQPVHPPAPEHVAAVLVRLGAA